MEITAIGFDVSKESEILEALPFLEGVPFHFRDTVSGRPRELGGIYVVAAEPHGLALAAEILRNDPAAVVFLQATSEDNFFLRLTNPEMKQDRTIERALLALQEVMRLSVKVRHDVRSPVQSIFDEAEKLPQFLPPDLDRQCIEILGIIQHNARRIYATIADFEEFHMKLQEALDILSGKRGKEG